MDIANLLEVQVNEEQSPAAKEQAVECKSIEIQKPSQLFGLEEALFFQKMFGDGIAQVRFRRLHCTGCDVHIGSAPSQAYNIQEHPLLKTLLCATCRDFYGDGNFEQGDDATDMFCRWCANGGNLYCCSYCSNTFCDKCIKRNFEPEVRRKIEDDEKWKCFVCDPTDLFILRSTCRALQQHIKTLSKILRADKSMSSKEIDHKMEQDDSKCCTNSGRRSVRKRLDTSSDDDSSTVRSRSPSIKRSRSKKRRKLPPTNSRTEVEQPHLTVNGSSRYTPTMPRFVLQELVPMSMTSRIEDDDIPPPLLQCEQTMIEGDIETVTSQGVILPNSSDNSDIPEAILQNSAIPMNHMPSQNIRGPIPRGGKTTLIPIRALRRVDYLPRGTTPQLIHRLPGPPGRPMAPMVSIPTKSAINIDSAKASGRSSHPNYLRCKNNLSNQEPSIIDLESDSEESTATNSTLPVVNAAPNVVLTNVEKITQDQSTQVDNDIQTFSETSRRKTFEDKINNPMATIDELLEKLRQKLKLDLDRVEMIPEDNEVHNARAKLSIINKNVDRVVNELAAFNNSMIQQYRPWKLAPDDKSIPEPIVLKKHERSSKYGSLDLECVRDSESDSEGEFIDEDCEMDYLLGFSNKIMKFVEKDTIDRGTLASVGTADKAIQTYEVVTMDYDKAIGYSLLMKAEYNYTRNEEVFKPVVIHDEYFGKYEEQFIFYLQNFEDHRTNHIETDNECPDLNEASLTDLIDADIGLQAPAKSIEEDHRRLNKSRSVEQICENGENAKDGNEVIQTDVLSSEMNSSLLENFGEKSVDVSMDTSQDTSIETSDSSVEANNDNVTLKSRNVEAKHDETSTAVRGLIEDDNELEPKLTPSQEAKHEETVIAVRTLIEEESNDGEKRKNLEKSQDECTILD